MKARVAGIAIIATLLTTSAFAAEMPVKAPPPPAPVSPWTGFYIGVNAGAGWLNDPSFTTTPGGTIASIPFESSLAWGESISGSTRANFTGGGQIGYSGQLNGNWVAGFESDIQYLGANSGAGNTFIASLPPQLATTVTNSFSEKTSWFGTVRARVGTTALNPNLLLYVTGGLAFGEEQFSGLVHAAGPMGSETFPFSSNQFLGGYTAGAGAEWMIASHWSIKAEYLWVRLGLGDQTVTTSILNGGDLATDAMTLSVKHDDINIARVGLNYRF